MNCKRKIGFLVEQVKFVHLRVRTAYSLLEGAITVPKLAELCSQLRYPAVGITDKGNLFGALEVCEALSENRVQPIIGCQLNLDYSHYSDSQNSIKAYISLIAKS